MAACGASASIRFSDPPITRRLNSSKAGLETAESSWRASKESPRQRLEEVWCHRESDLALLIKPRLLIVTFDMRCVKPPSAWEGTIAGESPVLRFFERTHPLNPTGKTAGDEMIGSVPESLSPTVVEGAACNGLKSIGDAFMFADPAVGHQSAKGAYGLLKFTRGSRSRGIASKITPVTIVTATSAWNVLRHAYDMSPFPLKPRRLSRVAERGISRSVFSATNSFRFYTKYSDRIAHYTTNKRKLVS